MVDDHLLRSDIVSIHAPLNDVTSKLMNESAFKKMKKDAVLLNLGRGGIIDDEALAEAIENDEIGAVGLDVLNGEPIKHDNPLNRILDRSNVYITPHIAWAAANRTGDPNAPPDHLGIRTPTCFQDFCKG